MPRPLPGRGGSAAQALEDRARRPAVDRAARPARSPPPRPTRRPRRRARGRRSGARPRAAARPRPRGVASSIAALSCGVAARELLELDGALRRAPPASYRQGASSRRRTSTPAAGPRDELVEPVGGMKDDRPLARRATRARRRAAATSSGRPTPINCRAAPAGLASGPSALKIVRTPSSRRTVPSSFIAGWNDGAKRKTSPTSSSTRPAARGSSSTATPQAARTSAEPTREEIERLPCLATDAPAPAATIAAAVERLKRSRPEPARAAGVEQRRARGSRRGASAPAAPRPLPRSPPPSRRAWRCRAEARPSAPRSPCPSIRSRKASSADRRGSGLRAATIFRASATVAASSALPRPRKLASSLSPSGVSTDSG